MCVPCEGSANANCNDPDTVTDLAMFSLLLGRFCAVLSLYVFFFSLVNLFVCRSLFFLPYLVELVSLRVVI